MAKRPKKNVLGNKRRKKFSEYLHKIYAIAINIGSTVYVTYTDFIFILFWILHILVDKRRHAWTGKRFIFPRIQYYKNENSLFLPTLPVTFAWPYNFPHMKNMYIVYIYVLCYYVKCMIVWCSYTRKKDVQCNKLNSKIFIQNMRIYLGILHFIDIFHKNV